MRGEMGMKDIRYRWILCSLPGLAGCAEKPATLREEAVEVETLYGREGLSLEGKCAAATEVAHLYREIHDPAKLQQWTRISDSACQASHEASIKSGS
jgi:hypothetical protein